MALLDRIRATVRELLTRTDHVDHVRWCSGAHDDIGDCVIVRTDSLSIGDRVRNLYLQTAQGEDEFGTVTGFDRDGYPYVRFDDPTWHEPVLVRADDVRPVRHTDSEAADLPVQDNAHGSTAAADDADGW
jgi:hypothetical protein